MLIGVQLGYYSGVIAGFMNDYFRNWVSFLIAAGLTLVSFAVLALTITLDFSSVFIQLVTIFFMFIAGMGASFATVCSIVSVAKNFDRVVSTLLVAIMITYLKTAKEFDISLHDSFFDESSDSLYILLIGGIVSCVYMLGALSMRKIDLDDKLEKLCKHTDPIGVILYVAVLGIYLLTYWTVVKIIEIKVLGVFIILTFLFINFLVLIPAVILVKNKLMSGSGLLNLVRDVFTKEPKSHSIREMLKMPKYICLLISTMCVVGAGYSYDEASVRLSAEAGAIGSIDLSGDIFWLCDALGRFGGGVIAYLVVKSVNGYMFLLIFSILALIGNIGVFCIVGLDVDGGFMVILAAAFIGLGVGGFWVLVAQIIIDDGGLDHYGMNWGLSILANYIGIFGFDLLVYTIDLKFGAALGFVIMGVIAVACTVVSWKNDQKK